MKSEIRKIYTLIGKEQAESILKYLENHENIQSNDLKYAIKMPDPIFYPATFDLTKFGIIQKTVKLDSSRSVYYSITEFGRSLLPAQQNLMSLITKEKASPQEEDVS